MTKAPCSARRFVLSTSTKRYCYLTPGLALLLSLALLASSARAQSPPNRISSAADSRSSKFVITPSLTVTETYTDNVFLSPDGSQQSDWITQVIPGISIAGTGPRLRLNASYTPELVHHVETERENKVFHRGHAVGSLELAEELFYVDAGARIDQYDVSLQGALTTSNVNISGNRATAATTYVSPYLLRNLGSAVRAEARFTYSTWDSDEDEPALPDNTARRFLLRLTNGPAHRLLIWDLAYSGEEIDYDTQQRTESEEFSASAERRITAAVSLLALAGYERYDTGMETFADPRWSAGFAWTPGPRTRLALTAGRRLHDETYGFQFSHRTRLTAWSVTYAEDVTTSREQFFVSTTQSTAAALEQMFASQYPDAIAREKAVQDFMTRNGIHLPSSLCSTTASFADQLFLQKRWLASVGLHGVRNTVIATGCWESRDAMGSTVSPGGDFGTSASIRTSGGSLGWGLRMTARDACNVQAGYTRSRFVDSGQANDFVYLQAGLTRQLQRRLSGSLQYRLQNQNSKGGGAEYRENAAIAALLMTF